jgi:hypothetical protein
MAGNHIQHAAEVLPVHLDRGNQENSIVGPVALIVRKSASRPQSPAARRAGEQKYREAKEGMATDNGKAVGRKSINTVMPARSAISVIVIDAGPPPVRSVAAASNTAVLVRAVLPPGREPLIRRILMRIFLHKQQPFSPCWPIDWSERGAWAVGEEPPPALNQSWGRWESHVRPNGLVRMGQRDGSEQIACSFGHCFDQ